MLPKMDNDTIRDLINTYRIIMGFEEEQELILSEYGGILLIEINKKLKPDSNKIKRWSNDNGIYYYMEDNLKLYLNIRNKSKKYRDKKLDEILLDDRFEPIDNSIIIW